MAQCRAVFHMSRGAQLEPPLAHRLGDALRAESGVIGGRFSLIFAFGVLAHQEGYGVALDGVLGTSVTSAALLVLLQPRNLTALLALAALVAADVVVRFDSAFNHWVFAGLLSLGLLIWGAHGLARRDSGDVMETRLSGLLLASLGTLYAVAGFHKLNTDFLWSSESCGIVLGAKGLHALGLPTHASLAPVFIGGTLAVELGLPLLLLSPRFRPLVALIGAGFHAFCSLAGYPRFSSLSLACMAPLLPAEEQRLDRATRAEHLWKRTPIVGALMLLMLQPQAVSDTGFLFVNLFLTCMVGVLGAPRQWLLRDPGRRIAPTAYGPWLIAPALIVAFGVAPYLGLGTERAFGMYSNVRTEGGISNHLIMRPWMQLFDYQRQLATVVQDSGQRVVPRQSKQRALPMQEIRLRISDPSPWRRDSATLAKEVAVLLEGRMLRLGASSDPLSQSLPAWQRKLLRFRAIEATGPRQCGV